MRKNAACSCYFYTLFIWTWQIACSFCR